MHRAPTKYATTFLSPLALWGEGLGVRAERARSIALVRPNDLTKVKLSAAVGQVSFELSAQAVVGRSRRRMG